MIIFYRDYIENEACIIAYMAQLHMHPCPLQIDKYRLNQEWSMHYFIHGTVTHASMPIINCQISPQARMKYALFHTWHSYTCIHAHHKLANIASTTTIQYITLLLSSLLLPLTMVWMKYFCQWFEWSTFVNGRKTQLRDTAKYFKSDRLLMPFLQTE